MERWKRIRDVSLQYFQKIYERLGVKFDHYTGESFFNDKMEAVIEEAEKNKLTQISDGALVIDLEGQGIETPALLRKADGATLYAGGRYDVLATWREKATDVSGEALDCGHFLPEEKPEETLAALLEFLG